MDNQTPPNRMVQIAFNVPKQAYEEISKLHDDAVKGLQGVPESRGDFILLLINLGFNILRPQVEAAKPIVLATSIPSNIPMPQPQQQSLIKLASR